MSDERDDPRGFRVTDRRRFAEAGDASAAEHEPQPEGATPPVDDQPATFTTFLLGLSTQALLHLGDIANPATGRVERDLGAAKHVIDILGILRDKTRGNVEPGEESLLESMLYDLRMRYVAIVRSGAKEGT